MNTTYAIKKILTKPESRLNTVYKTIDKTHIELALRSKGIHELNHDIKKLDSVVSIGSKLARTLRR